MSIILENVRLAYNTGFSLEIERLDFPDGGITGILGPNGSGKSTLLKIISGILTNDSGNILIDEKDISTMTNVQLARNISYVPPRLDNLPMIRLYNLLEAGRYPYSLGFGILDCKDNEKIDEALNVCDLYDKKNYFLNQLSSGELQRALIAKAIAQDTDIILMDEPFSNLDPSYTIKIIEIIKSLRKYKTIILAVHDVNIAYFLCDCLVGLKNGKCFFTFDNRSKFDIEKINSLYGVVFSLCEGNIVLKFR
jgi:iron complex transport system ATP-binding protein